MSGEMSALTNILDHLDERMKQLKAAEDRACDAEVWAHRLARGLENYLGDLKTRKEVKELLADYKERYGEIEE